MPPWPGSSTTTMRPVPLRSRRGRRRASGRSQRGSRGAPAAAAKAAAIRRQPADGQLRSPVSGSTAEPGLRQLHRRREIQHQPRPAGPEGAKAQRRHALGVAQGCQDRRPASRPRGNRRTSRVGLGQREDPPRHALAEVQRDRRRCAPTRPIRRETGAGRRSAQTACGFLRGNASPIQRPNAQDPAS